MALAANRLEYQDKQENAQRSAHSVLSVIGQARALSGGYGAAMGRAIVTASTASMVFGLAGFMLCSMPVIYAPMVGFLCGAQFGFTGGLVTRWVNDRDAALRALQDYPLLMEHHLRLVEPALCRRMDLARWAHGIRSDPVKQGMAVAAYYSCQDAVVRLQDAQEEALVGASLGA